MAKKVIYYHDEINDDFANTGISTKKLGNNFKYIHNNLLWKGLCFLFYYIIAIPLVFIINKIYHHQKFKNQKVVKQVKNTGYFIYSNHTSYINDCFSTPILTLPKRTYIIANPDATSLKGIRNIVQMLGAIPLGTTIKEHKEMIKCLEQRIKEKNVISIFPEAHIWPYYTGIRPFVHNSFKYPVKLNVPIFTITHCYQKRKFSKKPKIISYVDGPFYPNQNLDKINAAIELRNLAYQTMKDRAKKNSTYEYYQYIKITKDEISQKKVS